MTEEVSTPTAQKYEYVELFRGNANRLQINSVSLSAQPETETIVILFKGKKTSTFMIRRLRHGVSRNGNPWKKWEIWGKVNVSFKPRGKGSPKLNVYAMHRLSQGNAQKWQPFQNTTPRVDLLKKIIPSAFIHVFNEEVERLYTSSLGEPAITAEAYKNFYAGDKKSTRKADPYFYASHLAYPLAREFELTAKSDRGIMVSGIAGAMRSSSVMEATKVLFGKENYRKDLVRAVANSTYLRIAGVVQFRNLVPIDWIIKLLSNTETAYSMYLNTPERTMLRPLFQSLTATQRKRLFDALLTQQGNQREWLIEETLRMFGRLYREHEVRFQPGQIEGRSWQEIHDILMNDLMARGTKDEPIKKVKLAKKIADIPTSEDFSLILPETTKDLISWGKNMHHCIGSYASNAVRGEDVFIGIMEKGEMIGNAQIRVSSKSVVQIFGKRNKILDKEVKEKFSKTLISQNILSEHSFVSTYGW